MPTVSGRVEVDRLFAMAPDALRRSLRGAARAAATVVADEAKLRTQSSEVRDAIKVSTAKADDSGRIIARVQVKGPGAYLAPWEEYGTSPHFISVDVAQRGGRSVASINRATAAAGGAHSLVIGGKFVGTTVLHPGARPHPFLRPALDTKEGEALAAAQQFINVRVARMRKGGLSEAEGETS